jgi:hypothetical protein
MSARPFAEHAAVRTTASVATDAATSLPAGLEGYIVYVYRPPLDREQEYTVELIIVDGRGVQVDGVLIDVKHSQLALVLEAKEASPIRRLSESHACAACDAAFQVMWDRPPRFAMVVTYPVRCPSCGAVADDAAVGAIRAPAVTPIVSGGQ